MLSDYANQSLTLKHVTSVNEYNEPSYTTTTIKGRKETGFKLIRNAAGQMVVASAIVFTKSAVSNNDLIDGSLVISVKSDISLDGTTLFYEAFLL